MSRNFDEIVPDEVPAGADEALTLRALRKSNIVNDVVVAHDGVEALEYLFATGAYAGRDTTVMPQLTLLDLKMPRMDRTTKETTQSRNVPSLFRPLFASTFSAYTGAGTI